MAEIRVGDVFDGNVCAETDFGVFIQIDEKHDGLLHASRIPECQKGKSPRGVYKIGQPLKVRVIYCEGGHYKIGVEITE